ncbi:MAG: phosphotransferase [Methanobacteriota archaeon]|nr:MAG: phosphotransferase [Euryarchaeota archaeon]
MAQDLTTLDSYGWDALRNALNQRVVLVNERLIPSRRNRVWIVETDVRPVILKRSLSRRAENEFGALLRARERGLDVPFPLHRSGDYMVLEYVPGERCDSLINHLFSAEAAEKLGSWFARFHREFCDDDSQFIMADAELTNFQLYDGRIVGMDLEDSCHGEPMEDLGQLISSILGSEPVFTPIKFDLCMRLLECYESESGMEAVESSRPFVSKHLRTAAATRPLFRKTLLEAARSLECGWPRLA